MKSNKIFLTLLLCILSFSALSVTSYANCNGDVDNDFIHSTEDARLTLAFVAGVELPDTEQETAADIDRNGYIETKDALEILRIACGLSVAPEHEYTDWYISQEATCTQNGSGYSECFICGEQFHMDIPATGHYAPGQTCTTSGVCYYCNETLPPKGHTFVDEVCTECGYSVAKPLITYKGKSLSFGSTPSTIESIYGKPQDILGDLSEIGTVKIYVYCSDYKNLGIFTFVDNKLTQFYSNNTTSKVAQGTKSYSLRNAGSYSSQSVTIGDISVMQYTDYHAENGEYVYSYVASSGEKYTFYHVVDKSASEKLVFHLTNGMRALHNEAALTYCNTAAKAAYKHSLDMATRNYFDHYSPEGTSPGDRLVAEGIEWYGYGENIAAGYTDAYNIADGWYNSEGHRKNLLNSYHKKLGVGICCNPDSYYKFYGTQNFYT